MRGLTPGASCPVVPWMQPREPLERLASPRQEAWFYGLARLRKVCARDPESCARPSCLCSSLGRPRRWAPWIGWSGRLSSPKGWGGSSGGSWGAARS